MSTTQHTADMMGCRRLFFCATPSLNPSYRVAPSRVPSLWLFLLVIRVGAIDPDLRMSSRRPHLRPSPVNVEFKGEHVRQINIQIQAVTGEAVCCGASLNPKPADRLPVGHGLLRIHNIGLDISLLSMQAFVMRSCKHVGDLATPLEELRIYLKYAMFGDTTRLYKLEHKHTELKLERRAKKSYGSRRFAELTAHTQTHAEVHRPEIKVVGSLEDVVVVFARVLV